MDYLCVQKKWEVKLTQKMVENVIGEFGALYISKEMAINEPIFFFFSGENFIHIRS